MIYGDDWLRAQCGLDAHTLLYIYNKYCHHSVIDSKSKLYRLFRYFKQYPVARSNDSKSLTSLYKYIKYLASVVDELSIVWNDRHNMSNRIPHHFREMLTAASTLSLLLFHDLLMEHNSLTCTMVNIRSMSTR